jgi:hypothetical protein
MTMRYLTLLYLLVLGISPLSSQTYFYINALEIIPENPTNTDEISIHVFGAFASTGGYIISHSIDVENGTLDLVIYTADPGGATVIVPHDTIFPVGILPGGEYMITLSGTFIGDFVEDEDDYFFQVDGPNSLDEVDTIEPQLVLTGRQLSLVLPSSLKGRTLQILDVQGRVLLERTIQGLPTPSLDLSHLSHGNYILRLLMEERDWTRSFHLE